MTESNVQVSPSGGGPNVRTLAITEQQSDGTMQTVQMQVVSIANADGTILDLNWAETQASLMRQQLAVLRAISFQLQFLHSPRLQIEDFTVFMQDIPTV